MKKPKPLSREFLLNRGFCCHNGCLNCPYKMKNKQDLIETVTEQIKIDVHCGDYEAIEELITFCPIENLIAYLPETDQKKFKDLKEEKEIRTENALNNLIKSFPNDGELGKEIRRRYGRTT